MLRAEPPSLPRLGWVESCLPTAPAPDGELVRSRLELAHRHGLGLELEHREGRSLRGYRQSSVPVLAIQAFALHSYHPTSVTAADRELAMAHVVRTLEVAAELECRRALVVCTYGQAVAERPRELCLEFFVQVARRARALGVRVLVEPLSPLRAGAFTRPAEVESLLRELDAPDVFGLALDTGHILDSGLDPEAELMAEGRVVEMLQLRDAGSLPPPLHWQVWRWLVGVRGLEVVTVEHRQDPSTEGFEALLAHLRGQWQMAGRTS